VVLTPWTLTPVFYTKTALLSRKSFLSAPELRKTSKPCIDKFLQARTSPSGKFTLKFDTIYIIFFSIFSAIFALLQPPAAVGWGQKQLAKLNVPNLSSPGFERHS